MLELSARSTAGNVEVDPKNTTLIIGPLLTSTTKLAGDKLGMSTMVKATVGDCNGLGQVTIVALRKTGPQRDFFFIVLPYQQEPSPKHDRARVRHEHQGRRGCPAVPARDSDNDGIDDTFLNVTVGTKVCFELIPAKNTTVTPENGPQFYNAFVDVVGVRGNVQLDRRSVLLLVPPKDPGVN